MAIYNGTNGNDSLLASFGDDQLYGGAGDDTLDGSWGKDTLDGGDGIDTATYAFYDRGINVDLTTGVLGFPDYPGYFETLTNIENLIGSQGNDTLFGNTVNNILRGGQGNDLIGGGLGNDELYGDAGNDSLYGGEGSDLLRGGDGDDLLFGDDIPFAQGQGNDTMFGGSGNDIMVGWGGNDVMEGDNGDDYLYGMNGDDIVLGGNGRDLVSGGAGNDLLFGGNNDDILNGYGGSVWGSSSVFENDVLIAGGGADTFVLGEDTGADIIGVGPITLTYYLGDSYAVIADFNASEGDKIQLAGSMGDYSFRSTNVPGASFQNVGIFKDDDLIAAVNNVTTLSESNFVFV